MVLFQYCTCCLTYSIGCQLEFFSEIWKGKGYIPGDEGIFKFLELCYRIFAQGNIISS